MTWKRGFVSISAENGVKQGDLLAPTLFAIFYVVALGRAFASNDTGIYIRYRSTRKLFNLQRLKALFKTSISLIRDLLYADDCDLVTHTEADMQTLMDCFSAVCDDFGLTITLTRESSCTSQHLGTVIIPPPSMLRVNS